ncbi:rho GTPase-activating protein 22-like [Plectropomus leopardus]|uniref:rho GTPase-activating protein 22-like n=1 Tax=Plectropomus leopardus TaxID=160734 RepID=UPI001C4B33F3|nr:rho GTPase-activating protein 22-like [Plectropomus leopardus]
MELHCLPTETPTTASSCSTDPLYDNCPPFAQRGRAREKEMESRVACPAVTRLQGPCSPQPVLAPAVAEVPTVVGGGRVTGPWPDHSYCSWREGPRGQGWEAELGPGVNRTRGGDRGGEQGGHWGLEDRAHVNQSPNPSQSEEHKSALSLYDNLPDAVTPDSLQEVFDMETSFQEQMYQAWAPEQIQGLTEGEAASEDKSTWSSCEIILPQSGFNNQDQNPDQGEKHEQEPELDSGSCGFKQEDPMLHLQFPMSPPQHPLASSSQLPQTVCQVLWPPAEAQHPALPSWSPRAPPPVPLADPSASALRSLLTSLQQQIIRQREEYEERILSLEQRNEELQVEVVRLKTNLAQQRHWYHAIQAKIVESERARAAAELRNATLQKEMEQFFDTFGELNNEAKKTEYIVKSF